MGHEDYITSIPVAGDFNRDSLAYFLSAIFYPLFSAGNTSSLSTSAHLHYFEHYLIHFSNVATRFTVPGGPLFAPADADVSPTGSCGHNSLNLFDDWTLAIGIDI